MEVDSLFKVSLFGINFQQISSSVRRCVFFLIHTDSRIELDWCWYHNDFVNVFTMYEWIWQKKTNFFNVFNGQVKYAWLDANLLRICGQSFHSVRNASDSFVSYSCYCKAIKLRWSGRTADKVIGRFASHHSKSLQYCHQIAHHK